MTENANAARRPSISGLSEILVGATIIALIFIISLSTGDSVAALSVAQKIATSGFVLVYAIFLLSITVVATIHSERRMAREQVNAIQLMEILDGQAAPSQQLRLINRLSDARITTNASCRNELLATSERRAAYRSSIFRATASLLGGLTSVPSNRHSLEGLRPAAAVLHLRARQHTPRLASLGDIVIRLALLGTFAGLIAALTIASANVGIVQATEQAQSEQMTRFIQQLLASAATKFWISAIGIACAIFLRVWQIRLDSMMTSITSDLGLAFDLAIAKSDVSTEWCPPFSGGASRP